MSSKFQPHVLTTILPFHGHVIAQRNYVRTELLALMDLALDDGAEQLSHSITTFEGGFLITVVGVVRVRK